MVRFEPVRSAEPPTSSGSIGFNTSSTFWEAFRVGIVSALPFSSSTKEAILLSNSGGRFPATRRSNSAASAGNSFEYFLRSELHFFSAFFPPARASQVSRTGGGISNGGYGHPTAARGAAPSSAPGAAP